MRVARGLFTAVLAAGLCLLAAPQVFAGEAEKTGTKADKKKAKHEPSPARPSGVARKVDPTDAYYGGPRNDSITETVNELGQTVYSVAASHFDISPPLSELAVAAAREQEEEEDEAPSNPTLPAPRIIRSDFPDPVVQRVRERGDVEMLSGVPLAAPTTGFNFLGVGVSGGTPSDCNGAVGTTQFVETVNTRYQVWSLNRTTKVATSVMGPTNINTIWNLFGGACEAQNSGDPIVLFDRTAGAPVGQGRWLISQFTSGASGGVYYQCVAVSTTNDATGTYARYAFAVPSGKFGDYPHIAVWPDAYYMMAHGFGGQFVALFAAMDRPKMIAANPAATWVVIQDPNEGGHMPADLDGYTLPPGKAPGIFVSIHSDGMYMYRMKANFTSPGATTNTLQAIVPVAPANAACGGGTCIPQPGTGALLDALSDRLMFRAAYRNYVDHESLVVTHAVDPSVPGLVSGVRWYDFRLSGAPNATCPTYPCIYQQGTIADAPGGRNRWMSSMAMDHAENSLIAYTTTGLTAGSDNHSTRYTGRAKGDPLGQMTVPETTVFTGTANNVSNSRWGDYASMSIDPVDDCTFWSTSQYYAATNAWSTRIASVVYPAGTGAGQCQASTCSTRPATNPLIGTATTPADNQITVTWGAMTPTPGSYAIERAVGACSPTSVFTAVAATAGNVLTYTDTNLLAGVTYAYQVRGATDTAGKCNGANTSGCVSATATGACAQKPSFAGAASAASSGDNNCGAAVNWSPGTSSCLSAPTLRYNIYRATEPDFVPSAGNRIATCVVGPNSYLDTDNLQSGITYYYVVHAEDGTTGNGGACGGGNEDTNSIRVAATPYGPGMQPAPGTWSDGGGDGNAFLQLNAPGSGNTGDQAWRLVKTANDPGANHTPGGGYAYRNAGPAAANTYSPGACAEVQAPPLTVGATIVNLKYWERHQLEYHWDALAVEYSVNGGAFTAVPPPSNTEADGCAVADDTTGWEALSCTQDPPANACGYADTQIVLSGPSDGGASCANFVTGAITPYSHRCHQITGLAPNDTIRFRWRFSSDPAADFAGVYLDDVAVTNVKVPNACAPDTCHGQADGTACIDGDACTTGDSCGGGTCAGTPIPPPAETTNVGVAADKATYSWSAVAGATRYDVVRGSLSALPVGPGGGDEACFSDLPGPSLVDATIPSPGSGFWYLSRGENACSSGSLGQQSNGTPRVTTTCP